MQSIDLDSKKSDQLALLPFGLYASEINPAKNPAIKHEMPFSFLYILLLKQYIIFYINIKSMVNTPESKEFLDIKALIIFMGVKCLNFIKRKTKLMTD